MSREVELAFKNWEQKHNEYMEAIDTPEQKKASDIEHQAFAKLKELRREEKRQKMSRIKDNVEQAKQRVFDINEQLKKDPNNKSLIDDKRIAFSQYTQALEVLQKQGTLKEAQE